jgi:hypothetical protein
MQNSAEAARLDATEAELTTRRPEKMFDFVANDFSFTVSQIVADKLLSEQYGRRVVKHCFLPFFILVVSHSI